MAATVFINGRFLTQPLSGVQRYAGELVRALDRRPGAVGRYVLLAPPGADASPLALRIIPVRTTGAGQGHAWEQTALAWAARNGRLLSLGGSGPVLHPRQNLVLHDAAVFRHPDHFRPGYARFHQMLDRILARRATLATVSDFSRGELAAVLRLPAETLAVVPNGADHLGRVGPDRRVIEALGLTRRPYFVALGNRAPNKNLAVLIRALARLPDPEVRLVLIGGEADIFSNPEPPTDPRLVLAGRRSDAEIAALLRGARALVFPSLYEGFGIPPLEAMAEDCPVIASDIPATREVCADAALYFAPHDDAALAEHMAALLDFAADPARMAVARAHVAHYRWDASAKALEAWLDRTEA